MAEQRKKYGGAGHRNPNRKAYDGHVRPERNRPLPPDFRDLYIRHGWNAQYFLATNWRVMVRWIEEAGGDELRAARKEWLASKGAARIVNTRHVKGWTAEKLEALHRR